MRSTTALTSLALLLLGLGACGDEAQVGVPGHAEHATHVDDETCFACHREEKTSWTGSHHQLAMTRLAPRTRRPSARLYDALELSFADAGGACRWRSSSSSAAF